MSEPATKLQLRVGRFYRAKNGAVWLCYRRQRWRPVQAQADCINVETSQVEYFFADGRYDEGGDREHTLVAEVPEICQTCQRGREGHTRTHPFTPEEL